jgi:hypothetical protein
LEQINLELLWIELKLGCYKILYGTLYRPPNAPDQFWTDLSQNLNQVYQSGINVILISGDLNADFGTRNGQRLQDFLNLHGLSALINEPTRITRSTSSILDQFLINIPSLTKDTLVLPPVSNNDHCTITTTLNVPLSKPKAYKRTMWDFKNADFEKFRKELSGIDFSFCENCSDLNNILTLWSDLFLLKAKSSIPSKIAIIRPRDKPWFSGFLRRLLRKKNRVHLRAKKYNTIDHWAQFRSVRNQYFREIKRAKEDHETSKLNKLIIESKYNVKKWWSLLKDIMGLSTISSIPPILKDDIMIANSFEKANLFNEFFAHVTYVEERYKHLPELDPDQIFHNLNVLDHIVITRDEVRDQLSILNTKKSYGPDGIPPLLLKEASPCIADSLCLIFNKSLTLGVFPKS